MGYVSMVCPYEFLFIKGFIKFRSVHECVHVLLICVHGAGVTAGWGGYISSGCKF